MRLRNANRTGAGTTLIAVEAVAKLIEVGTGNRSPNVLWPRQWRAMNPATSAVLEFISCGGYGITPTRGAGPEE